MKETTTKRLKTGGRAKGTPNKVTTEIREFYKELIENNLEQIKADLKELTPKERIEVLIKLSEYVIPKLNKVESNVDSIITGINIVID
jgi:DNA primase catalytic subunit